MSRVLSSPSAWRTCGRAFAGLSRALLWRRLITCVQSRLLAPRFGFGECICNVLHAEPRICSPQRCREPRYHVVLLDGRAVGVSRFFDITPHVAQEVRMHPCAGVPLLPRDLFIEVRYDVADRALGL